MRAAFAFILAFVFTFAAALAIHADESRKPVPSKQSAATQPTTQAAAATQPTTAPAAAGAIRTKGGLARVTVNGVLISDPVLAEAILVYNRNIERAEEVRRRSGIANATLLSDELTAAIDRYEASGQTAEAQACKLALAEIQQKMSDAEARGRKHNPAVPHRRAKPEDL